MLTDSSEPVKSVGKTSEALQYSRAVRREFLRVFGVIPESILKHDRAVRSIDLFASGSYNKSKYHVRTGSTDRLSREFHLSGSGTSQKGVLSRFPQNIGRILCLFYCPENGTVYDPFAGHNSRMELVFKCDRHYIGVDVCGKFMDTNRKIREMLLQRKAQELLQPTSSPTITLIEGSSANVPSIMSACADFTITSPPYWDIEYYGDEAEQLGKKSTYEVFLLSLSQHILLGY